MTVQVCRGQISPDSNVWRVGERDWIGGQTGGGHFRLVLAPRNSILISRIETISKNVFHKVLYLSSLHRNGEKLLVLHFMDTYWPFSKFLAEKMSKILKSFLIYL